MRQIYSRYIFAIAEYSKKTQLLPAEIRFLFKLIFIGLAAFALVRLGLLWRNWELAAYTPALLLIKSFLVGIRFDLAVLSYLLVPLLLWMLIPKWGWQYKRPAFRVLPWALGILFGLIIFICFVEIEFYREFHQRLNRLAFQYLSEDPATVLSMIWNGYPVIPYLLAIAAFVYLLVWLLKRIMSKKELVIPYNNKRHWKRTVPIGMVVFVLLIAGSRGGFNAGAPLRWGDAYFSNSNFANHLALNGIFTLGNAALNRSREGKMSSHWLNRMAYKKALSTTRKMVLQSGDQLHDRDVYPLLRVSAVKKRTFNYGKSPKHIVLILMESFSAEFVGRLGAGYNATPVFDRLIDKGILFDRFFSQGTHTHQGLFATLSSFPNLPGFEFLMQNSHGQQAFRSFPAILKEVGFSTTYVYNGRFTWDNQEGFFRNQGMQRFVGVDDYVNPRYMDPTWGVSDEDMFVRGVAEIDRSAKHGRAFVLLQTVSNHAPFKLPAPAPFSDLKGPERLKKRLNGIRYSDWALGRFFQLARTRPWFKDTLFVILGDHGFGYQSPKAMLDLGPHHVPLLLYYPGDRTAQARRIHTVSSQVDVLPTVLGLARIKRMHQSWGRDLFRLARNDPGWAVIKSSGDSQVVGLVHGSTLLVVTPKLPPQQYRYRLNPWRAQKLSITTRDNKYWTTRLYSYIVTGLGALLSHRAGVVTEAGHKTARKIKAVK